MESYEAQVIELENGDIKEAFGRELAGCADAIEALRQDMRLKTHAQVIAAITGGRNGAGNFEMRTANPTYAAVDPHPLYTPGKPITIVMDKSIIPEMIAALHRHYREKRRELMTEIEAQREPHAEEDAGEPAPLAA